MLRKMFKRGPISDEEFSQKCPANIQPVKSLEDIQGYHGASTCHFEDNSSYPICQFAFAYLYRGAESGSGGDYILWAESEQKCPEPPNTLGIVAGLIAAIVAIGLLTLIVWKVSDSVQFTEYILIDT